MTAAQPLSSIGAPHGVAPLPRARVDAAPASTEAPAGADTASGPATDSGPPQGSTADALRELADVLRTTSIGLRFEIDDVTNRVVTQVVDKETGELIRQIPSEEVLRFARALDKLQGVFVSQSA